MKNKLVSLLWVCASSLIGSVPAGATIRYASTTGGNIAPYDSWAKAARLPGDAVDLSVNGDTLYIAPGSYPSFHALTAVTVAGVGPGVIINGYIYVPKGCVISGLDITGSVGRSLGGGVRMEAGGTIQDCRIYGNRAESSGAGIFTLWGTNTTKILRCEVFNNVSGGNSAGVACSPNTVIENCSIHNNVATNDAGGVSLGGASMAWCDVYSNRAGRAGGVWLSGGGHVVGSRVHDNQATNGAGMVVTSGTVARCWISHNTGKIGGGVALYSGGGLYGCVVDYNTAANGNGGGVYFMDGGTLDHCTIANNSASGVFPNGAGGGVYHAVSAATVNRTIIYYNTAVTSPNRYITGSPSYYAVCTTPVFGTAGVSSSPAFVSYPAGNYRLGSSSPCVDAVPLLSMIVDIEGTRRPLDGNFDGISKSDIGAYERGRVPLFADYDGDGEADLAVYDPAASAWYISSLKWGVMSFGSVISAANSIPVRGDFDGAGRSEFATFKDGFWTRRPVGGGFSPTLNWGFAGCLPVAGDYDGDGRADVAVFYPPTGDWYIRSTLTGATLAWATKWGFSGCIPVSGDYDGDGTSDLALYDPGTGRWYIGSLTRGVLALGASWGFAGCTAVPGDYNGDGHADLAVYHAGTGNWYVRTLSGTVLANGVNWGFAGCKPVSGDFDSDGRCDLAIYHQPTGNWYIRSLTAGVLTFARQWGWAGANPVQ